MISIPGSRAGLLSKRKLLPVWAPVLSSRFCIPRLFVEAGGRGGELGH